MRLRLKRGAAYSPSPWRRRHNPQLTATGELQHLLSIDGLPREILTQILDTAESFAGLSSR